MNTISFMGANYVARQVGYAMHGWGHGDKAANAYFSPVGTFGARFEEILRDIQSMSFTALDMWTSHLNYTWATEEHIAIAQRLLHDYGMTVTSFGGWFGSTPEEFEACCRLAVAMNTRILGGSTSVLGKDRDFVIRTLKKYNLVLGIENHPEKTPTELLEKIGDTGDGTIGATLDTGWFGTQGYNAARAIDELREHLILVHLKDVLAPGEHDTCRYGQGIVPIKECVQTLKRIGYTGAISIEHEPEKFDPTRDCEADFAMLKGWLNGH